MRVVTLHGPRQHAIVEKPDPWAAGDVVVVKVLVAPIGDEFVGYRDGTPTESAGQEAAGDVVEVARAGRVKVGDRVVVMPGYACGNCYLCRSGHFMYCEHNIDVLAQTNNLSGTGTFAQYIIKPDWMLLPIPESMSYAHASMACGALAPTFGAMQRMGVTMNDTVLIVGLGPVGLGGVIGGAYRNARVLCVESNPYRAELARTLGAEAVIHPDDPGAVEQIRELTDGRGVDKSIDCTGVAATQALAISATRRMGQVAFVDGPGHVPHEHLIRSGLTVHGSCHYALNEAPRLMRMIGRSSAAIDRLITHRFTLDQIDQAFELQLTGQCGKVLLEPWRTSSSTPPKPLKTPGVTVKLPIRRRTKNGPVPAS